MSDGHEGGCLCGDVRYRVAGVPLRVTICHCTFCQRLTGSAYLVEPIFQKSDIAELGAPPRTYDHVSDGSGKRVTVHFCGTCGSHLWLSFERFSEFVGICAGTFDDPSWFDRGPDVTRHIFIRSAQAGTVLPAGFPLFDEHAIMSDGRSNLPTVLAHVLTVARRGEVKSG